MNEKSTYTGSKIKNHFTAYLINFLKGRRSEYLNTKITIAQNESYAQDFTDSLQNFEELFWEEKKEEQLMREAMGNFPEWNALSDNRLMDALMLLSEEERRLIYQHVFAEKTFAEMSVRNGLSEQRVKTVYYYAIRKIRKMMGVR